MVNIPMKRKLTQTVFLTLLLISNLVYISAYSQKLNVKTGEAIRTHTYDEILDYVTIPNGQTFVFIKTYGTGKIIIHQVDENLKLIKRKPLNKIKYLTGEFAFKRAFILGDQILMIGTVYDSKTNTETTVMTGFNTSTMTGDKTCIKIFESELQPSLFTFGHIYEFDQSPDGKFLGMRLLYTSRTKTGENSYNTQYHTTYFLINEKMEIRTCSADSRDEKSKNYTFSSFVATNAGTLLIAEQETEKVALEGEYWKDKKQLLRIASAKSEMKIHTVSFANSGTTTFTVSSGVPEIKINLVKLISFENQVYITGFVSNSRETYRQSLISEKEEETDNEVTFFYFQPLVLTGTEILINEKNTVFLNSDLEKKLITNPNLTEMDCKFSANENIQFHFIYPSGKNKFTIVAEKYTEWQWPPYETMKNDSRYVFTKDEKGEITDLTGPGSQAYNEFTEICLLEYRLGDSVLTVNSIPRKYSESIPFEESLLGSSTQKNQLTYLTKWKEPYLVYLSNTEDKKNELFYSAFYGTKEEIKFNHKWAAKMVLNSSPNSGLIIVQDLQTYTLIKLME